MENTALINKMPAVNKTAIPRGRLISLFPSSNSFLTFYGIIMTSSVRFYVSVYWVSPKLQIERRSLGHLCQTSRNGMRQPWCPAGPFSLLCQVESVPSFFHLFSLSRDPKTLSISAPILPLTPHWSAPRRTLSWPVCALCLLASAWVGHLPGSRMSARWKVRRLGWQCSTSHLAGHCHWTSLSLSFVVYKMIVTTPPSWCFCVASISLWSWTFPVECLAPAGAVAARQWQWLSPLISELCPMNLGLGWQWKVGGKAPTYVLSQLARDHWDFQRVSKCRNDLRKQGEGSWMLSPLCCTLPVPALLSPQQTWLGLIPLPKKSQQHQKEAG